MILRRFSSLNRYIGNPRQIYRRLLPGGIVRVVDRFPRDRVQLPFDETGKLIVFPYPSMPWHFLFQRTQQLARGFARMGLATIYATGTLKDNPDNVAGTKGIEKNLSLYNDGRNGELLGSIEAPVSVWQHLTTQDPFISHIKKKGILVYDYIDNLRIFAGYDRKMEARHRELLGTADLVVCASEALYDEVRRVRKDALYVPNGVDYDHFSRPVQPAIPLVKRIRERNPVIIGFYGSIAHWIDYDIITTCARKRPGYLFLLVGHAFPGIVKKHRLNSYRNVRLIDHVPYADLTQYLSVFDVAVAPFVVNRITAAADPIKVYEYLAAGKPVVVTDLAQFRRLKHVLVARDATHFADLLDEAVLLKDNDGYRARAKAEARDHTWEKRIEVIEPYLFMGRSAPRKP